MIRCKLCGCEKETARQMHGHMMRMHEQQYREASLSLEAVTEGYSRTPRPDKDKYTEKKENQTMAEKKKESKNELITPRPAKLRLLNKSVPAELEAYNEGYRYLDPDEQVAYTTQEVKEEGWL